MAARILKGKAPDADLEQRKSGGQPTAMEKKIVEQRNHAEILLNGTTEEQAAFIKDYGKKMGEIGSKIKRYAPREIKSVCQSYGCVR